MPADDFYVDGISETEEEEPYEPDPLFLEAKRELTPFFKRKFTPYYLRQLQVIFEKKILPLDHL